MKLKFFFLEWNWQGASSSYRKTPHHPFGWSFHRTPSAVSYKIQPCRPSHFETDQGDCQSQYLPHGHCNRQRFYAQWNDQRSIFEVDKIIYKYLSLSADLKNDFFFCFRDNLEWLARATNWAKLTATASLGVIHRGHEQEALTLMQSYLPKEVGPSSGYSEGGGLYALGLIHANHGANIIDYLLGQLKDAQNEVEMNRHVLYRTIYDFFMKSANS